MTYSVDALIPQAYCEKFTTINVLAQKDVPTYVNALNIFNCDIIYDNICYVVDSNTVKPSQTTEEATNPEVVVVAGHVFCNEDGIFSATVGTVREEVLDYIETMIMFLGYGDATQAFATMTLLSNSTQNVISENLASVRRKPFVNKGITPCSL